ncbi:AAA family ATPase [Streptomyces sp. NPDC007325]|uniref:AAA family ATPase n=1 Tax=Streptomyces sp. NPDC007325 TaxID=3154588 RepID=UPI0033F3A45C
MRVTMGARASETGMGSYPGDPDGAPGARFGYLRKYSILGLFDFHNHTFHFDVNEPTILTGSNGTGKSTVLRTINWISSGDWASLARLDFGKIVLDFDNAELVVRKIDYEHLEVTLRADSFRPKPWRYSRQADPLADRDLVRRLSVLQEELPFDEWEELSASTRQHLISRLTGERHSNRPLWIEKLSTSFPVVFVSDQRLAPERRLRPKKRGAGDVVDVVAAIETAVLNINSEVESYKSQYGTASQNLDRDFPRRVFSAISSPREYDKKRNVLREFQEVQELRASLADTGLISYAEVEESITDLPLDNPDSLALISTYLSDTREKLSTFEPLRRRLEPFMEFLRRHYKDKEVRIDEREGFKIRSLRTGAYIRPVHLSSGEQQIFILAHKVLFGSDPETLIMIDEPELSLHVLWQSTFLDDLTEISAASGTYFLLATHSPTLIAGRSDLRRSLDG